MGENSDRSISRRHFMGALVGATCVLSGGRQFLVGSPRFAKETNSSGDTAEKKKKWFEEVQTYGTVTLPPALAEASHLSVNGLASAIGHASVVRMFAVYQMYPDDESYIRDIKAKGIRCSAYVSGFILRQAKAQLFPILNQAKCIGYFGNVPTIGPATNPMFGGQDYYLCNNRPACGEFQIELGKRAIDLGVDCIFFDEIQGSTTTLMPQLGIPGFCPDCLGGFTAYLRRHYTPAQLKEQFDIGDLDQFDFRAWLGQHSPLPDMRQVPKDQLRAVVLPAFTRLASQPVVRAYQRYQFEANHQKKSAVIRTLREYAQSKGRAIAITANISNLDVGERPSLPFMIGGLEFAEVVDFMACEINTAISDHDQGPYWPSGKWVSYYRLGQSVCKAPTVLMGGSAFGMGSTRYKVGPRGRTTFMWRCSSMPMRWAGRWSTIRSGPTRALPTVSSPCIARPPKRPSSSWTTRTFTKISSPWPRRPSSSATSPHPSPTGTLIWVWPRRLPSPRFPSKY